MDEVRLKKITDSIGLMQKNLECSICLDLLQDPVSTKCDHQFCNFCVLALLQSSSKPSARCPLCKGVITKRSLTKNEQLDQIVKAVRSVITAVEEDSGLRCSPPRGPVLFSQPDPKPRQPTPLKKVKGQISSKAKGQRRAGNVRKTKRKTAETVSVYRDDSESSDSDVFELPSVGHTNITSSFPRLKTSGKKGYHDDDQGNEELEKEAEDLLAALNTAPLTSHGDIISGYSNDLEQRNNEINLLPISSGNPEEKESQALKSQWRTCQGLTPPADSEIFEVPAPRINGKVTIPKERNQDPYEFVPSQRTPRKVKKKVGRKKNQNAKKEFPIRTKGRFTKQSALKRDHKSASSCSESDPDIGINQSKTGDKPVKLDASAPPQNQRNICADSKTRNVTPTSGDLKNGGKEPCGHLAQEARPTTGINEEDTLLDSADVVIDDAGDVPDKDGNAQDEAAIAEQNLIKRPLPITPVVVIKRGVGNIQGSQQSSEGGMMTDSQPVVINRNHGRRVFATTYGKARNGLDKSPPLDPQERILDWLVSKNAGSDESDDEEEEKEQEVAENSEEPVDIFVVQENDEVNPVSLPIDEDKDARDAVCKIPTIEAKSGPAKESIPEEDQTNKKKLTTKKRDHSETLEGRDGRRRSGRRSKETSQEKSILDSAADEKDTAPIKVSPTEIAEKDCPPKRRTAKQRMEENLKEQTESARKESEAAAIKSDWELALELARQFGTEPDHLKAEPTEGGGRSSRRRKGILTVETVHENKPVRKSRRHAQENQEKEIKEFHETFDIDSFETQNVNRTLVKTTVKEKNSIGADKIMVSISDKRKPSPGSQSSISAKDHNGEVQHTDSPEAAILKIPETPYILNQPKGKMSHEGEQPPNTGLVEVESQEQVLGSSRLRKTVNDTKGSSSQSTQYCTPESKSSQPLTSSLRRSKRGSQPPNNNSKVDAQVMAASMKKEKKAEVTDEILKNETDLGRTRGNVKEQSGADDWACQKDSNLPVMQGAEREVEEKLNIEETALASLPLYTEDIPVGDKDCIKKCRGSDTTESIDLEIESDEYEEPDSVVEKELEPSSGGSPAKKNICSSSSKIQQKPSLDEEMSIMNCILPSMTSQECPSLGISPGLSGNSSGTASDLMRIEAGEVSMSKKPEEVVTVLSGSGGISKEASQASVTIISQTKTSGSFPPSLDLNSQPSESLLQPLKKSKRKASHSEKLVSTLHAQDGDSVEKIAKKTSPGAKQQVEEIHSSSGSGNSRPTRRISRRKRKTFTINASPSVPTSKEMATPPSWEMPIPDSLEQNTASSNIQTKSKAAKEVNQLPKSQSVPTCKETHKAYYPDNVTNEMKPLSDVDFGDNMEASGCSRPLRKGSKSTTDRKSVEVPDEKLKSALIETVVERKKSRSLPTSDSQIGRKRATINIDESCVTSQETLLSDVSGSSLKLKRKSRNGSRQNTQSPVHQRDIEESVVQSSPSDQISDRLPDDELDGKCNEASRVAGGRRSSSTCRRSKMSTKPQVSASCSSAIPTTPGASEISEQSSNAIIPARPFKMHSKENLDEGADISMRSQLTPRSSPRVLRRSARQSKDVTQPQNKADEKEDLEQRKTTLPQECITVVDESIGISLAEKEESQESSKSLHSVEDIFNYHEESRDMFDDEETANDQETMGNKVSQSLNADIVLLSEELHEKANGGCSQSGIHDTRSRAGYTSQAKPEIQRESPGAAKKSQHLNVLHETNGTKEAMISQGSFQYDDTEALIPPTPPCHDLSKSRTSSFLHTNGLSKAVAKRKKAPTDNEPDMSSLLYPNEEITKERDSFQAKSLVMETPTVISRRRNKVSQPQTKDKSIADTPVKVKQGSVGQKGKEVTTEQNALTFQDEDQEIASEHTELSVGDQMLKEPLNMKSRRVTSQTIEDTASELPIKSSNESDEITRTNVRRRKQVITDDVSDDNDNDNDDDDNDEEIIGRQRRKKAQRMVQVARDEEDESDDELIPCSFLQTSVRKPLEQEEDDEENPMVTFGDQANPLLGHEVDGGSVSSEDSCASHHMNLTSASSILSSQSEIMNTQQQEKTREDMQALEEQMAELQAALARERGSRSHDDDTNDDDEERDEEEEEEEENPRGLLVEETEGACTPDSKQSNSASPLCRNREGTKHRSRVVEISDEEIEIDGQEEVEPRSPSPPPPLSPSTVRKASSSLSMTDSIRSVTSMVEQYRKSSSKKATTKKRRIEDNPKDDSDDDVGSDEDVAMVSSKSSRSSGRSSKKRRIERDYLDSEEDEIQDELNSPPNSRSDLIGRKVERSEIVHLKRTPNSRTTPMLSDCRASGSRNSPSNTSPGEGRHTSRMHTPKVPTPQDHLTPRRTPNTSPVPSPVDVSMKTQRTSSDIYSPAQSRRRSGDQSVRTPEAGPGPSPRLTSRPMSLIATGLNRVELRQVEQLTSRLANCRFASAFNANTTHVIVKTGSSLVCERTLKYFQGIAARAWIVSFQWIHDSLQAKKLLREEDYEVRGDVVNGLNHHGPKRARTCEGPGFMAKFDLCCIGPFTGLNKDQLVGLCEMCGASTVQHPSLFPYNPGRKAFIVVEPNLDTDRDYHGLQRKFRVPVISREWILDSIAHYKSQPIAEYLLSDLTNSKTDQPIIDLDSDDDQ